MHHALAVPSLLVLIALAVLVESGSAQQFAEVGPAGHWPPAGLSPSLSVTRAMEADLNDDGLPELVVGTSQAPAVCYGFGTYHSALSMPHEVVDFAIAAGTPDRVLALRANGLWRYTYDPGQPSGFVAERLLGTAWAGAQQLRCADLDGDGDDDAIAVDPLIPRLLVAMNVVGGIVEVEPLPLAAVPLDLETLRWLGDDEQQIAILEPQGLRIVSHRGEVHYQDANAVSAGCLAAFSEAGEAFDRLAVVVRAAQTGEQWFTTLDASGLENAQPFGGALDVYSMTAGDVDGDGDEDLALGYRYNHVVPVLYNQSAQSSAPTFHFAGLEAVEYDDPEGSASEQQGHPLLLDSDRDGDLDLGLHATGQQAFLWAQNLHTAADQLMPGLHARAMVFWWASSSLEELVHVDVHFDAEQLLGGFAGLDEVEVLRFVRDEPSALMSAQAAEREYFPIEFSDPEGAEGQASCRLRIDAAGGLPQFHYVVARAVSRRADGGIEACGPPRLAVFTLDLDSYVFLDGAGGEVEGGMEFVPNHDMVLPPEGAPEVYLLPPDGDRHLGTGAGTPPCLPCFEDDPPNPDPAGD